MHSLHLMKFLFGIILIFCFIVSPAQKLSMAKSFGGVRFSIDTVEASPRQVLKFLEGNDLAYNSFKGALAKRNLASLCGFTGGLLIGLQVGTLAGGGKPQWGLMALGGGLVGLAIPIDIAHRRQFQKTIDTYNAGGVKARQVNTKLYLSGRQVSLVIRF